MSSKRSNSSSGGSSSSSFFSLGCGCKNSKSVSVSGSISTTSPISPPLPTVHSSFQEPERETETEDDDPDSTVAPTFSGLLRQLSDLEKTVLSLTPHVQEEQEHPRQRRTKSIVGGDVRMLEDESVTVVKETDDPLGDFRRSMLQMIVEKEIVTGEELRRLLKTFLSLNSPRHHDFILRAFADIWNEVFSCLDRTTGSLRRERSSCYYGRSR